MTNELGWIFPTLAIATWVGVPCYAAIARGRVYAIFAAVLLTLSLPAALVLHGRLRMLFPPGVAAGLDLLFAYSMAAAAVQLAHLVRARMRSSLFRWAVSVPAQTFIAGGMLAGPWLLVLLPLRLLCQALDWTGALTVLPFVEALPLAVAVASIATSIAVRPETVRFRLGDVGPRELSRVPVERFRGSEPTPLRDRPLRLVQLTDTHLGPWQSVRRLRERIASLVAREPDLVVLTGDFLTMESMGTPGCLEAALEPLAAMADRCIAIFGNHDHEAPETVRRAMAVHGIRLLVDDEACLETPVGPVQIVGADYRSSERREHLAGLLDRFPRRAGHLRLLLLHDPSGFHALPEDEVDLVLSGHTHGGHLGLVSLGLDWTVLSRTR